LKRQISNSIRLQLLCWLLLPLCTLWLITATIAYFFAVSFSNDAYDRELLNSADSVAARLRTNGTKIWVDLPPAAQAVLRYNNREKFYYQVSTKNGTRISGDAFLPRPRHQLESVEPIFRYAKLNSQDVRMARIRVDVPNYPDQTVLVQVAETLNNRTQLAGQILFSIVFPQIMLIIFGAMAVSYGISRGLLPLKKLELAIAARSPSDLAPVSEVEVPSEALSLVHAINDLLLHLRKDIESQQRFVANAAHQLRTPLAGLKTYIYAAKRLPSEERMQAVLDQIDAGTDRMSRLALQLLSLAKAGPSNNIGRHDRLDLNFIVGETTAEFAALAVTKNLDLIFNGTDEPAVIVGDSSHLAELTTNLVENAINYTPSGGSIVVSVKNGAQVTLSVQDNGPGIPDEEREHVFERFYRVLGTEEPGSGLGLSIVKEIAVAHKAEVFVSNGPGGVGTTVEVVFPPAKDKKAKS
jgi:two-component system, OmpR family, sensor histidine kinase TctE